MRVVVSSEGRDGLCLGWGRSRLKLRRKGQCFIYSKPEALFVCVLFGGLVCR